MSKNIENIISKYWAGKTSLEEEQQLRSYLSSEVVDPSHHELIPLFELYTSEKEQNYKGEINLESLQSKVKADADQLLDKYFLGETTLGDEEALKMYFSSSDVKKEHIEYAPLFNYFVEQEAVQSGRALDMSFLEETKLESIPRELEPKTEATIKAKTRRLFPRVAAVAASLLILMMFTFNFFNQSGVADQNLAELEAQEALETTMDALAYLGVNYDKGANPMKHMKQLEKTNIFKFN